MALFPRIISDKKLNNLKQAETEAKEKAAQLELLENQMAAMKKELEELKTKKTLEDDAFNKILLKDTAIIRFMHDVKLNSYGLADKTKAVYEKLDLFIHTKFKVSTYTKKYDYLGHPGTPEWDRYIKESQDRSGFQKYMGELRSKCASLLGLLRDLMVQVEQLDKLLPEEKRQAGKEHDFFLAFDEYLIRNLFRIEGKLEEVFENAKNNWPNGSDFGRAYQNDRPLITSTHNAIYELENDLVEDFHRILNGEEFKQWENKSKELVFETVNTRINQITDNLLYKYNEILSLGREIKNRYGVAQKALAALAYDKKELHDETVNELKKLEPQVEEIKELSEKSANDFVSWAEQNKEIIDYLNTESKNIRLFEHYTERQLQTSAKSIAESKTKLFRERNRHSQN